MEQQHQQALAANQEAEAGRRGACPPGHVRGRSLSRPAGSGRRTPFEVASDVVTWHQDSHSQGQKTQEQDYYRSIAIVGE